MGVSHMNIKKLFYLLKINIAKVVVLSCVFLFAFILSNAKVEAQGTINVIGSTYSGNGGNTNKVTISGIPYIQGTGIANKDGITFEIKDMYTQFNDGVGFSAFAVWESGFSSGLDTADYDRWYVEWIDCSVENACNVETLNAKDDVAKDADDKAIVYPDTTNNKLWYIRRENQYYKAADTNTQGTIVDFTEFFTTAKVTYTYRIRNANAVNLNDGFGYKRIYINYWNSSDASGDPIHPDPIAVEFGLVRAIDDVEGYTNNNLDDNGNVYSTTNPVVCSNHTDYICVDYVDYNGDDDKATINDKDFNIYIPDNVLYQHYYTTKEEVTAHRETEMAAGKSAAQVTASMVEYIDTNNSMYSYNYFCEGAILTPATITYNAQGRHTASCSSGATPKQYVYVDALIKTSDATSITVDDFENVYQTTSFMSSTYKVTMKADTRGNVVIIIRDMFGNENERAVTKVMDILNQTILVTFEKGNKTNETVVASDGWKANEYYAANDVQVKLTMTATTIVKNGFPIVEATTTDLDSNQVKIIEYWRVQGREDGEETDVCVGDEGGASATCASKPASDIITLYEKTSTTDANPTKHSTFVGFDGNKLTMKITSNGRYRFYIETFSGNNTNTSKGEQKNPRVEMYKIDQNGPEILFGTSTNSYCSGSPCSYSEETFQYYQGTGNPSGTVLTNTVPSIDTTEITIEYTTKGIYYLGAGGVKTSISGSALADADIQDVFFGYMHALFNSKIYIRENIVYYGSKENVEYSYFQPTSLTTVQNQNTAFANTLNALSEEAYREYVIRYNIKYTSYGLATITGAPSIAGTNVHNIKIEYMDADNTNTTVCGALADGYKIDLNGDNVVDQQDCVNFYLDHAKDFIIKITAYDLAQDSNGNYIEGNNSVKEIKVNVVDTTAPGFSQEIRKYNVSQTASDPQGKCRMELGNLIGSNSYQTKNKLLECFGIKTTGETPVYNFEDNALDNMSGLNVELYILSLESKQWVKLSDGYTPNRSGLYAILVVISDNSGRNGDLTFTNKTYHDVTITSQTIEVSGNSIASVVSYYVDKKIVLISPESNSKSYGDSDPVFEYTVSISNPDTIDANIVDYLSAPFTNMSVFDDVGKTENAQLTEAQLLTLFKGNKDKAAFTGALDRQESASYNKSEKSNEYVGLYKIVLGTLNIEGEDGGYDLGADYIVKINPNVRNEEYQLRTIENKHRVRDSYQKCNLVISQKRADDSIVSDTSCYAFTEDDDAYVESTSTLTIKQVILNVSANGSNKDYGSVDINYAQFNNNAVGDTSAYLNGYTVTGLKWSDTASVVQGVLRREIGENVGLYSICNFRGTSLADTELETTNNMLVAGMGNGGYTSCSNLVDGSGNKVDTYASVTIPNIYLNGIIVGSLDDTTEIANYNGYIASRALYIAPNKVDGWDKTLNTVDDSVVRDNTHANYVISYTSSTFKINAIKLIAQPTPGQRREYNFSGVDEVNPWELVVYGLKTFEVADSGFNGYTENSPVYSVSENDEQSVDTEGEFTGQAPYYNNKSEDRDEWKLIDNGTTYIGFKTNETHSLFGGRIGLDGRTPEDGVYKNMNAGWYDYKSLAASTLVINGNGRSQCDSSNGVLSVDATNACKNYNLTLDLSYRNEDGYKNGDTDGEGNLVEVVYKSKLGYCRTTETFGTAGDVGVQCGETQSSSILFEVYRREIILEFNSKLEKVGEDDIVYGQRYGYYRDELFAIDSSNNESVDGSLFYCYATYKDGVVGTTGGCRTNKWYGLTDGDSWTRVGLSFKLHDTVIDNHSDGAQHPIPAARYYVFASITDNNNYKFNYLGGTLTIKTKIVDIQANSYVKEYGNVYYDNQTCLNDGSILNVNNALISIAGCDDYGFVVTGMDSVDTIADNFIGRPKRESKLSNTDGIYIDTNGLQENVGIYPINVGSIHASSSHGFNACNDLFLATSVDCVVYSGVDIDNYITANDELYDLVYYLYKDKVKVDGSIDYSVAADESVVNAADRDFTAGTLTINPATIKITVTGSQTKMHGCSYNEENVESSYNYSYSDGYSNCVEGNGTNFDLGYAYTVSGDKDYYIYVNGYYDDNYDTDNDRKETNYSSSGINVITNGSYAGALGGAAPGVEFTTRSSALNGGVLYRVKVSDLIDNKISYASLVSAADAAQAGTHYQRQSVGKYVITLGNLNASLTSGYSSYDEAYNKCDASNLPSATGEQACRNYIIDYYDNKSTDENHEYTNDTGSENYIFTITPRIAFVYADYNTKVYGNAEPVVTHKCVAADVVNGFCELNAEIEYGITRYYTKFNSLAKAPWVASIEGETGISFESTNNNDIQTDVVEGTIDRYGIDLTTVKNVDDPVGNYHYKFSGINKTSYATDNYKINYQYRTLVSDKINVVNGEITNAIIMDGDFEQAVYSDGGNQQTLSDGKVKKVVFEIALRKISVTLVDFAKVYGIADNEMFFEFGVCADNQTLGYNTAGDPICSDEESEHGLSPTHKAALVTDGIMDQEKFRTLFGITFKRTLGENVTCLASGNQTITISGKFPGEQTQKTIALNCQAAGGYKVIGIIDQSVGHAGFNYEVNYVDDGGVMTILARKILITPESGQTFQYGSYMGSTTINGTPVSGAMIPAIKYGITLVHETYAQDTQKVVAYDDENKVVVYGRGTSGIVNNNTGLATVSSGLVNAGNNSVCLTNIDGSNSFCINDKQDQYKTDGSEQSVDGSGFVANTTGSASESTPTYVFGDQYQTEALTGRSALNRKIKDGDDGQRYNRNVGEYIITRGDLQDKSGNYNWSFTDNVSYIITPADVVVTPVANQKKVYGEADIELEFTVQTKYTVNSKQYVIKGDSYGVVSVGGVPVDELEVTGGRILVEAGQEIVLNGYAYFENGDDENYNYGHMKNSKKISTLSNEEAITQTGDDAKGKSFDKYCYDNASSTNIAGCLGQVVSFEKTTLVLIGYLYVNGYAQNAGEHLIVNGLVVADNEFNNKNYSLDITTDIMFTIEKLDIKLDIKPIEKIYGESTDAYKCDAGIDSAVCSSGVGSRLTAIDHENTFEYNFNIFYKGESSPIAVTGSSVLMVNAINGNYYTQTSGAEDKNTHLGVYVARESGSSSCQATDTYGCEDVGTYGLVLRKFSVSDNVDKNYNLLLNDSNDVEVRVVESANWGNYIVSLKQTVTTLGAGDSLSIIVLDSENDKLTITKRDAQIFVNTNLNSEDVNYYQIEQNVEAPQLPTINNSYNLEGYTYTPSNGYHTMGASASSSSTSPNLASTYTHVVWGSRPVQVRTSDALVGELAYCNQPTSGLNYVNVVEGQGYPVGSAILSEQCQNLVYNDRKSTVNTNTSNKFIMISRDANDARGLKIMSSASSTGVDNNTYEDTNYNIEFFAGAIKVVGDDSVPVLTIGTKDYYIEANAKKDGANIIGSYDSIGTILEYLFNGTDTNLVLAGIDSTGNLYIVDGESTVYITQGGLAAKYGVDSKIVSGVEQNAIYPFVSNYANVTENGVDQTYLNEENITSLQQLITTFIKWFNVSSYDKGQYIEHNNQYLDRKFDKYYYVAINKYGYNVANGVSNEFAINKVATYDVTFYVMDNAGNVSIDGNVARLHIIDTTKPSSGELNLYGANVKCDTQCDLEEKWYIADDKVRLSLFNRYKKNDDDTYTLDAGGEYIRLEELGHDVGDVVYKKISELKTGENPLIIRENYIDYVKIGSKKYRAIGIAHYSWSSNPDGVYLTITGAKDNSYTDFINVNSQWKPYYSITGGAYWVDYDIQDPMEAYSALKSDGAREIQSVVMDSGVNIVEVKKNVSDVAQSTTINYDKCYKDCEQIIMIDSVYIDEKIYLNAVNDDVVVEYKGVEFQLDTDTSCVVSGTVVTCNNNIGEVKVGLKGNVFTYNGYDYILADGYVLDSLGEYKVDATRERYVIDGIDYYLDRSAQTLTREYIAEITGFDENEEPSQVKIDGNVYDFYTPLVAEGEPAITYLSREGTYYGIYTVETSTFTYTVGGMSTGGETYTYQYVQDLDLVGGRDYYVAKKVYNISQSDYKIGGEVYNVDATFGANSTYQINGETIVKYTSNNYTDTYRLHDKRLIGLDGRLTVGNTNYSAVYLGLVNSVSNEAGWNVSILEDDEGQVNAELDLYLYGEEKGNRYFKDKKTAYLDTLAPQLGMNMTLVVGGNTVTATYGEKWYVFESGYYNEMSLSSDYKYVLGGNTYTIDFDENIVKTSCSQQMIDKEECSILNGLVTYPLTTIDEPEDETMTYVYEVNYTKYYINSTKTKIKWLNSYVDKYVGAVDGLRNTSQDNKYNSEIVGYNLHASTRLSSIEEDAQNEEQLISSRTTENASGIGATKYPNLALIQNLFDFVDIKGSSYNTGIYYQDVEYIVSYTWKNDENVKQVEVVDLNDEFKACYEAEGKITQACAQAAISQVITHENRLNKDVTYTINYIVRDKAGNVSDYVARGVLYATVSPTTHVVINTIPGGVDNTPVVVTDLGNNTYSLQANQGVSLDLLQQAFSVNYASSLSTYNKAAVMTIYREGELIAENVKGVAFTDYIDSSEIGQYTVIYNMNSVYTTYLGQKVPISGETITLNINITSPNLPQTPDINVETIVANDSSPILFAIIIGFIGLMIGVGVVVVIRKKKS